MTAFGQRQASVPSFKLRLLHHNEINIRQGAMRDVCTWQRLLVAAGRTELKLAF
jgi:hypothetical protein